jgi:hypothetical protein
MRRSQIDRLDQLIALVEQRRLSAHGRPCTHIYISGGLPDRQRVGHTVGQFRIHGGLPPLSYALDPYDADQKRKREEMEFARLCLLDALAARIDMLVTAASPIPQ